MQNINNQIISFLPIFYQLQSKFRKIIIGNLSHRKNSLDSKIRHKKTILVDHQGWIVQVAWN